MTFKLREIIDMREVIEWLLDQEMNIKASFLLSKFLKSVIEELNTFEDSKSKIVKKYGTADDKGIISVDKNNENYAEVVKQIDALLDIDIEIDFEPISIEEFGNFKIPNKFTITIEKILKK